MFSGAAAVRPRTRVTPNHRQKSGVDRREVINIGKIREKTAAQRGDRPKEGTLTKGLPTACLLFLDTDYAARAKIVARVVGG